MLEFDVTDCDAGSIGSRALFTGVVEHRSRVGRWKSAARSAWQWVAKGNVAGARARFSLLILTLDQKACDRGSWVLSVELSLEQGPPMAWRLSTNISRSVGCWMPDGRRWLLLTSETQTISSTTGPSSGRAAFSPKGGRRSVKAHDTAP